MSEIVECLYKALISSLGNTKKTKKINIFFLFPFSFFFGVVLGLELRTYTLRNSTSPSL
jgi:hypothetical protein